MSHAIHKFGPLLYTHPWCGVRALTATISQWFSGLFGYEYYSDFEKTVVSYFSPALTSIIK